MNGEGEVKQMLIIRDYRILSNRPIDYVDILLIFIKSFLIKIYPDEK